MPRQEAYAWLYGGDGMIGWGEVARYKATSLSDAEDWWAEFSAGVTDECELRPAPAGAGLVAFGSFVFDPDNSAAQSALVVPRTVVGRRCGRAWRTTIGSTSEAAALAPRPPFTSSPFTSSPCTGSPPISSPLLAPRNVTFADGSLSPEAWAEAVDRAVNRISVGELDKVVLARDLVAHAEEELDLRWLVRELAGGYPRCWTYLVDGLVGATPEMLVRREGGRVTSRVLAGTIRRTGDDARDLALAAGLARSSKDLEEHEYAVASVARALAPYCSQMQVPEVPHVLELPNVLHLATDVTGEAESAVSALALAAALHPSAAVCGTPTALARKTIGELEQLDRERYAGPVGWLDAHGDGEWGIALRCGQLSETDPREMRLFAGCGIVAGSDPQAELAESVAKLVPMREALGG